MYRTVDPVDAHAAVEPFAEMDGGPLGMTLDGGDLPVTATDAYLLVGIVAGKRRG